MSGFYDLPSEQQVDALRALLIDALEAWDLGALESVELLAERENAVFEVCTDRGRFVGRVHRAGYHTDDQLRSQVAWMRALRTQGVVETADVVDTRAGDVFTVATRPPVPEARQVSVLEWVGGEQLSSRLQAASGDELAHWYHRIGALAAGLHEQVRTWRRPAGFSTITWDVDGLLGERAVWGRFWALEGMAADDRAVMEELRARATAELARLPRDPERYGLIHNDFLAENLLVDGDRLTLLDFDDCGESWFAWDLTPALVSIATREDYPSLRDALVDGYREVRPLDEDDLARLPLLFALRMATYAAWLDTRSHTQFAKDLGPVIVAAAVDVARRYLAGELEV
ncbi:phosphotransferase enzyme family protein [Rhabdothermincola sediminis]|uniref:phosphotransferase enzyme family protein n=1 Tax=Rhabdothermincola sediminis TaxID=2751370 RepID=UPI001AA0A557|nr:phosphotransferase [Rhabdothermincola sediminis]